MITMPKDNDITTLKEQITDYLNSSNESQLSINREVLEEWLEISTNFRMRDITYNIPESLEDEPYQKVEFISWLTLSLYSRIEGLWAKGNRLLQHDRIWTFVERILFPRINDSDYLSFTKNSSIFVLHDNSYGDNEDLYVYLLSRELTEEEKERVGKSYAVYRQTDIDWCLDGISQRIVETLDNFDLEYKVIDIEGSRMFVNGGFSF